MSVSRKKRKCKDTGKITHSKNYYLKHRFEGDEKPTEISLRTPDKRVAQERAKEYVMKIERERSGLYVTDKQRVDGAKTLQHYVEQYIRYLIDKGTTRDHYRKLHQRLSDGLTELEWTKLSHINKADYQAWLKRKDWSLKTRSHYQTAFKAFSHWLYDEGYTEEIPLSNLRRIRGSTTPPTPPAALNAEEAKRLLQSCPEYRSDFYAIMICTGLRAIEVNRLRVSSVTNDESGRSWICLKQSESKARRHEFIEVADQLLPTITRLTAFKSPESKLLPKGRPTRATFTRDLKSAGIAKKRFDGSCVTMHSLRKTFITLVHQLTDSDATKRQLARHSSVQMSDALYTDRKALNYHKLLQQLPEIVSSDPKSESISSEHCDSNDSEVAA